MSSFRFRLQTVFDQKNREVENLRTELFKKESELAKLQQSVDSLKQDQYQSQVQATKDRQKGCSSSEMAAQLDYYGRLQADIEHLQDQMLEKKGEAVSLRSQLVKAMQKRKTLEKLRDKQYAEWKQAIKISEERFVDEVATMHHTRRVEQVKGQQSEEMNHG